MTLTLNHFILFYLTLDYRKNMHFIEIHNICFSKKNTCIDNSIHKTFEQVNESTECDPANEPSLKTITCGTLKKKSIRQYHVAFIGLIWLRLAPHVNIFTFIVKSAVHWTCRVCWIWYTYACHRKSSMLAKWPTWSAMIIKCS